MKTVPIVTDPLAEHEFEVLPQLLHKYPNRVLCLLTTTCRAGCPFCFRKNLYEQHEHPNQLSPEAILHYLSQHPEVEEFIFSGGEPLLEPELLEQLVMQLKALPTIKIFRIHSRLPIIQPKHMPWAQLEKIAKLVQQPLYFVVHVNTVAELQSAATQDSLVRLRQLGFILLSHTVFLKTINDSTQALAELFTRLVEIGVKPYYIFHCDNMPHTQRFIVDIKKEIAIMSALRKTLSGIAYPLHVIDSSSGHGKIPVPTNFWQADLDHYTDFFDEINPLTTAS